MSISQELNRFHNANLLTRIGIAIYRQSNTAIRNVHLEINEGHVTVRGKLPTEQDRQLVLNVVRRVSGVLTVQDETELVASTQAITAFAIDLAEPEIAPVPSNSNSGGLFTAAFRFVFGWGSVLYVIFGLVGCAKESENASVKVVEGKILYRGQPLANAFVVFHPKANQQHSPARASTDALGNYQATSTSSQPGILPGEYLVTVHHYPTVQGLIGKNVLSPQLSKAETTDIRVTVHARQTQIEPIEVYR